MIDIVRRDGMYFFKIAKHGDSYLVQIPVSLAYEIKQVSNNCRSAEWVKRRDSIVRILRNKCSLSFPEIGELIGRDHTTAMHSFNKTKQDSKREFPVADKAQNITREKRTAEYLKLYEKGATLDAIGALDGITRERVRQIITCDRYLELKKLRMLETVKRNLKTARCLSCKKQFTTASRYVRKYCTVHCEKTSRITKHLSITERACSKCNKLKSIDEYHFHSNETLGVKYLRYSYCKDCHRDITVAWKSSNPERAALIQKKASMRHYLKVVSTPALLEASRAKQRAYYWRKTHQHSK